MVQQSWLHLNLYIDLTQSKKFTFIKHTIYEKFENIQQFKHEWSLIMCENAQKLNKYKGCFITYSHI